MINFCSNLFSNGGAAAVAFWMCTLASVAASYIMVAYSADRDGARGVLGIVLAASASTTVLLIALLMFNKRHEGAAWLRYVFAVSATAFIVSGAGTAGVLLETTTQTPLAAAVAFVTAASAWLFMLAAHNKWVLTQYVTLKQINDAGNEYDHWGNLKDPVFYGMKTTELVNFNPTTCTATARQNAAAESMVSYVRRTYNLPC